MSFLNDFCSTGTWPRTVSANRFDPTHTCGTVDELTPMALSMKSMALQKLRVCVILCFLLESGKARSLTAVMILLAVCNYLHRAVVPLQEQ